jgi:hypothetical protein
VSSIACCFCKAFLPRASADGQTVYCRRCGSRHTKRTKRQRGDSSYTVGGIARAAALSPERRSEIARAASQARWAKVKGEG